MRPPARRWVALAAVVLAVVDVSTRAAGATSGGDDKRPLIKVAVWSNGKCGKFAYSLPTVVSRRDVLAGDTVSDVVVCVTNDGKADGALSLAVVERLETDVACTGDEPLYDDSCGGGGMGELGPELMHHIGVGSCSSAAPPVSAQLDRRFPAMESPVVVSNRLRAGERLCTRLVLRYLAEGAGGAAGQSDRTTWRYVFAIGDLDDQKN